MTNEPTAAREGEWLVQLRPRLLEIARRRVPADDVEDVVQTTLGVIVQKGPTAGELVDDVPSIAWCLQVLRNVIGNHYKRLRTQRRTFDSGLDVETLQLPIEALASEDRIRAIESALAQLDAQGGNCGDHLRRLAVGAQPHELAAEAGLEPHAFYQRLYRCRQKFRVLLRREGLLP